MPASSWPNMVTTVPLAHGAHWGLSEHRTPSDILGFIDLATGKSLMKNLLGLVVGWRDAGRRPRTSHRNKDRGDDAAHDQNPE